MDPILRSNTFIFVNNQFVAPQAKSPPVTESVHRYTKKVLDQAREVANAIQHPVANVSSKHSPYPYSSSRRGGFNFFAINIASNNYGGNGNNDAAARVIGLIVGVITVIGGAVLLGKLTAKNDNLDAKIKKFAENIKKWEKESACYSPSPDYQKKIQKVVDHTEEIMERNQYKLLSYIYKVALPIIFGGGLLFAGALTGASLGTGLMTVGAVTLLAAGGYGIYKAVRNANTNQDAVAATKILKNIRDIENMQTYRQFNAVWA